MAIFLAAIIPFIALPFFVVTEMLSVSARSGGRVVSDPVMWGILSEYSPQTVPRAAKIGYGYYVVTAMRDMGLVLDHFDVWISEHPESALKHIKYMPSSMQKDVAGIALFIRKSNGRIDPKTAWREAAAFVHYSAKYGVPSALATAVAHAESTFNPDAVSSKGASGVMQVMWKIHNGLLQSNGIKATPGRNPLADPEHAIAAGCLLLSRYMRAYGSIQKAMDRYYGGNSSAYQRRVNINIANLVSHQAKLFD
jgi:hypothetical protein